MEPRSQGGMKTALIAGAAMLLALGVVGYVHHRSRAQTVSNGHPQPGIPVPAPVTGEEIPLQVVSEADGSPIAGAVLTFKDGAGSEVRASTDREGRAVLPKESQGMLVIKASGYVGCAHALPWTRADRRVALSPAGSLVIRFTDKEKRPVAGVEIEVLPAARDAADLLWQPVAWRQASNADGQVSWPGLAPASGYRWTLHSAHYVGRAMAEETALIDPATNTPEEKGDVVPAHRSDPFEIRPGAGARFDVTVSTSGSVSGILAPAALPNATGWVKAYHVREYVGEDGAVGATRLLLEAIARTDRGGAFRFRSLRPGKKRVVAHWQEPGKSGFDKKEFDLHPGEDKSLGTLRGLEGLSVPFVVRLKCDEKLRAELAGGGTLEAVVRFSTRSTTQARGVGNLFDTTLVLNVDEPRVVQGVPEGDVMAEAWIRKETPGVRWKKQGLRKYLLPAAGQVEMILEAARETSLRLSAAYPSDQPACPLQIYFFPDGVRNYGFAGPMLPAPEGATKESSVPCSIPPGSYTVWALPRGAGAVQPQNYFAEARIRVEEGQANEVRLTLGPGAILKGRVVDGDAMPVKKPLRVKIEPFNRAQDPFVFSVSSDDDGRFTLVGIPPGRDLRIPSVENDIPTGAAGSETIVQVEVDH